MIPDDKVAEVRDRTDIVGLIGEFVALKRAGVNWKGLCPFHQEKTPSFNVNAARQIFHCFGCGVGGDAFGFLMRFEGRTFTEAVRELGHRAGIALPETQSREAQSDADRREKHRERLLAVTAAAAEFYTRALLQHPASGAAREYLRERGIGDRVREKFQLGFAPPAWDELGAFLRTKSVSPADAEEAGLLVSRSAGHGHYDRFRNRLMCPVFGTTGKVIAFSGRLLPGAEATADPDKVGAKYINSPESAIFHKGDTLFGLHAARVAIRQMGFAILVEGNFDLLQMHEQGIENVVAPMGTAFTAEQGKVLRRYAEKVVLVFDGDEAGKKAARAAFAVTSGAGLRADVALLPEGEDPDSFLRRKGSAGADAMRALASAARGIVEHLIEEAAARAGASVQDRAAAIRALGETLAHVRDPLERDMYLGRIASAFGVEPAMVLRHLRGREGQAEPRPSPSSFAPVAAPAEPVPLPSAAEMEIFGAVLDHPVLGPRAFAGASDLESEVVRAAIGAIAARQAAGAPADAASLLDAVPDGALRTWASGRLVEPLLAPEAAEATIRDNLERLKSTRLHRESERLTRRIAEAQSRGDAAALDDLIREKNRLRDALRNSPWKGKTLRTPQRSQ